jgi:predicted Zn finger-like uncharacterized protein
MLITTCTHCVSRFRVTPQQLNAKQGQVRCGRCGKVFSGFEALERFPDDDTGARLLAAMEASTQTTGGPIDAIEPLPLDDDLPIDLPLEELPDIETLDSAPPPPAFVEEPATPSTPLHAARPAAPRRAAAIMPEEAPPPKRPSRAWSFGVMLLALLLAGELAYAFRGPVAQRYPVLRPWLESACSVAGCTVPWQREDRLLKLEDSELLEVPGKPSEIALGARIRNLATSAQEYPHLELTLTDLTGQAAARRVLRPIDYMGRAVAASEVLAPGAEIALQLRLETPRIKATGYELLLFYP